MQEAHHPRRRSLSGSGAISSKIKLGSFDIGQGEPLFVICGPCVIEDEGSAMATAAYLAELFGRLNVHFIYKSSYDKANRLSAKSFRGVGIEKGLQILETIKKKFHIPVITDVHTEEEAKEAAAICSIIQIPALLCRQTSLITTAAKTGCPINIKKGQFMAPSDMRPIVEKARQEGNEQIMVTERGSCFGYHNLVSDFRSILIMQEQTGAPVCFDATHSVQYPGKEGEFSGGESMFAPYLAKAAVAVGADGIFLEAHHNPKVAKSDAACMIALDQVEPLIQSLLKIRAAISHVYS